jgi:two-component system, OmpR family, response regulator ChvI
MVMHTIGLVDDDRNLLASVPIAFETEGYRIVTYAERASSLDAFERSRPDLAILGTTVPDRSCGRAEGSQFSWL